MRGLFYSLAVEEYGEDRRNPRSNDDGQTRKLSLEPVEAQRHHVLEVIYPWVPCHIGDALNGSGFTGVVI
jgi:hypothetical protein